MPASVNTVPGGAHEGAAGEREGEGENGGEGEGEGEDEDEGSKLASAGEVDALMLKVREQERVADGEPLPPLSEGGSEGDGEVVVAAETDALELRLAVSGSAPAAGQMARMMLLYVSATKTTPDAASTATPIGLLNSAALPTPSALPFW